MSTAAFNIMGYIKTRLGVTHSLTVEFYPGRFAPAGASLPYMTYSVVPGNFYEQPYRRQDAMKISISHSDYSVLSAMCETIMSLFAYENIKSNTAITALNANIRYSDIDARVVNSSHKELVDSTEYFENDIILILEYVVI